MLHMKMQKISAQGMHRLRIAARFLRKEGCRFDGSNFYDLVTHTIYELDQTAREYLRGLVDWVEQYEIFEREVYGEPTRSRARKIKTKSGRRGALRPSASGATE